MVKNALQYTSYVYHIPRYLVCGIVEKSRRYYVKGARETKVLYSRISAKNEKRTKKNKKNTPLEKKKQKKSLQRSTQKLLTSASLALPTAIK